MRLAFLVVVLSSIGRSEAQGSWLFWYDCSPGIPGCQRSNARSFCTPPDRPEFQHISADPTITNHPFVDYLKTSKTLPSPKMGQASTNRQSNKVNPVSHVVTDDGTSEVDGAPTTFGLDGIGNFATNSEYVAAIWSVGFFLVLGITVWRGCGVVDRHPELAVSLIEGCVTCRTGKRKPSAKAQERPKLKNEGTEVHEAIELSELDD